LFKLAAIALAAVLIAGAALAHKEATGIIAERMAAMKNMGRELKAIGDMLVGNAPFDAAAVVQHADALHENCHRTTTYFRPAASITTAKPCRQFGKSRRHPNRQCRDCITRPRLLLRQRP
jgi:cytochrome c556